MRGERCEDSFIEGGGKARRPALAHSAELRRRRTGLCTGQLAGHGDGAGDGAASRGDAVMPVLG